ncbi:MAG: hypothetical protein GC202_01270 [Alphaproteobacteria bacterium]|nr:hypothetical protein [Alphaproteobacteria bacterium]
MTDHIRIAARLPRCRFVADGAQSAFAFDFAVFRPEDIEVRVGGAIVATGFAVALGPTGTGSVTFDVPPPAGMIVVLRRQLSIRRETDFQEGGELRAKTLNDELDFQTAGLQQVETAIARALHVSDDDPDDAPTQLPPAAARARKALVFDAEGNPGLSIDDYADQAANAGASAAVASAASVAAAASAAAASTDRASSAASESLARAHRDDAAASAAAASDGALDATAAALANAIAWNFDLATTVGDPGAGGFRFDAPTPVAATAIMVSALTAEPGTPDISDFVASWAASTNPAVKGYATLRKRDGGSGFAVFAVRDVVDLGGWLRIDVTHAASSGAWVSGDGARIAFARAGDKGLDGAGTIVSIAAADASIEIGGTASDRTIAVGANAITPAKLARLGSAGQVLTSNGGGVDASFQSLPPGVPAGIVVPFAGTVEPAGWLFAAGQAVSRAAYEALFAALGTTYGAGDGSTTFNLPDLRGRVPAGRDNMNGTAANRLTAGGAGIAGSTLGASGGAEMHALTTAQIPSHGHVYTAGGGGVATGSSSFGDNNVVYGGPGSGANSAVTGGGQAHPNVQPTIVLNHIVKT